MKPATKALFLIVLAALFLIGATPYRKPPQAVLDVLNAPTTPTLSLSPTRTFALQAQPVRYPPIAELSQPMLRLAGLRINPKTNGLHNTTFDSSLTLRKIPSGEEIKVELPPNPKLSTGHWSYDGAHFAFTNTTNSGIELWIGETATGKTHKVEGVRLNAVMGGRGGDAGGGRGGPFGRGGTFGSGGSASDIQWMPDNKTLLVEMVKPNRGPAPVEPSVPTGPHVQESLGGAAPVVTHEDMIQTPHDEDLFEYYATSQLAYVDAATGKVTPAGKPGIVESVRISPDAKNLLVTVIHRPFSYLHQASAFPKEIEIWDHTGKVLHKVASQPLEDKVPINGVMTGPRSIQWRPSEPATLIWVEALDNGDLKNPAPFRDKIVSLKAPFNSPPHEILKTEQRFSGIQMTQSGGIALVEDSERRTRRVRTYLLDIDKQPDQKPKLIWSLNNQDRYHSPGSPLTRIAENGERVLLQDGDNLFLGSLGGSPKGDHPFLDRFNLTTQKTERLFQCDDDHYEVIEALLDSHGDKFLTRRESPTEPPNYFVRTAGGQMTAVTHFADPQPIFRKVTKQLVTYNRPDGVPLSFDLYLPPGYKPGTRLPTIIWAYPREFNDADTAGQVSGSSRRFTEVTGYSQLFHVLDGYAVLDNAAMPVVGSDPDIVNNTYIDQIVADAKAAIDKATEMGVTDPARVGVGGHSYGGFMTANLLAHCDLFKAGVAESGAHNRTLTPFGFQSERRTIWQAPDVYLKMSPFMYADKIKTPILLIHGEADDNDGTFPIQSDRMYQAVRGNGGTVRLVFLPFEAHGYRAKETTEHVIWEKMAWFNKYVKNAGSAGTNN
ncbi:MAG TPA: prolyl oligopeptidase family serine peptidase [Candidatus Acidoferrales bacterium]|jgi:dipeptidyl aminopeptidase/acylaminoacyl peptidase|nr:prolyl oligopeptidase family serine peptidase [Candidatus Acidoferrales bacterium]